MNTGDYIRRQIAGRLQKDVAAAAGMSPAALNQLLSGKRSPSINQAVKLDAATEGAVKAEELHPVFFEMLEKIGWKKI